jgi:hypothetical protein
MATPGCRARLCVWEGLRLCQRVGCLSLADGHVRWCDEDVRTGVGEVAAEAEADALLADDVNQCTDLRIRQIRRR